MNTFITETAAQALSTFAISQRQYETIGQLLNNHSLSSEEVAIAQRMVYGVRHGILELI